MTVNLNNFSTGNFLINLMMMQMQQQSSSGGSNLLGLLFGQQQSIFTQQSDPFDSTTNQGFGANQALNYSKSSKTYTRETNSGNTIEGTNGKKLSVDSTLAYSDVFLKKADGVTGNCDGKVSVEELNTYSNGKNAEDMDLDKDGFISRAEHSSNILLADKLDGKFDGKISLTGCLKMAELHEEDPEELQTQLTNMFNQIEDADSDFQMNWTKVDGTKGPYDKEDTLGKYANSGYEHAKNVTKGKNLYTEWEFAKVDMLHESRNVDSPIIPTYDINTGLASHTEFLKTIDRNNDGKVSTLENLLTGGISPDLDDDGFISAGEYLAETMLWDRNKDGKLTYEERLYYKQLMKSDDYEDQVRAIYNDKNIDYQEESFEMPEKIVKESNTTSNSLLDLIKKLFGLC